MDQSARSIAIICFLSKQKAPEWPGEIRVLPDHLFHAAETVRAFAAQTDAEYVLFWDDALGEPNIETCRQLLKKPGELWHAGLKLGSAGKPEVLNMVNPVWLQNLDAPAQVASDCWRMSLRACLMRTEHIRLSGGFRADFSSFDMAAIEWGYRLYRSGVLLRYQPELAHSNNFNPAFQCSLNDSLIFSALHSSKKWFYWVVFRLLATGTPFSTLWRAIRKTRSIKQLKITKLARPLEPETLHFNPANWHHQVSVLMPTLNRYPYAINSFEQLARQTIAPKEVLSTDQTDSDQRWEGFAAPYPDVQVFPQTEKGQCIAWNKLLEVSSAPYVLFLDDDVDGIRPDFLEQMCRTMAYYQADMVASNVIEIGGATDAYTTREVKLADGFPITLIRRELVMQAGMMDMAFNKGIRADQDLAIRCRLLGAHMIFDSHIRILHHRAPVGGLRWHKQRVLTRHMSKNNPFQIQYPAETEYYLFRKYFSQQQRREHAYMLIFSQMIVSGSWYKKMLRLGYFIFNVHKVLARYRRII